MQVELVRAMEFSAAHEVPGSPYEPARRLHGHTFTVELRLEGPLDRERGWLVDFAEIRRAFAPCAEMLDHSYLNEIEGLETPDNPTLERWIFERVKSSLPYLRSVHVRIAGDLRFAPRHLFEDAALELPARLGFGIECAHSLPNVEPEHKCRRIHGHSFRIEVGAGDLDHLGRRLRKIYNDLDHRYLNEIEGLENPTSENLARWIWRALEGEVPDLAVVVVRESPDCASIYRGAE